MIILGVVANVYLRNLSEYQVGTASLINYARRIRETLHQMQNDHMKLFLKPFIRIKFCFARLCDNDTVKWYVFNSSYRSNFCRASEIVRFSFVYHQKTVWFSEAYARSFALCSSFTKSVESPIISLHGAMINILNGRHLSTLKNRFLYYFLISQMGNEFNDFRSTLFYRASCLLIHRWTLGTILSSTHRLLFFSRPLPRNVNHALQMC